MIDFFKHARWYLAGKWGQKRRVLAGPGVRGHERFTISFDDSMVSDAFRTIILEDEIARLKRNKKKHSHLQAELDALVNGVSK